MANNLAITSVYSKTTKVLEPNQSGRLRRNKKHKDGVEVSISRGSTNQNHVELLNMLKASSVSQPIVGTYSVSGLYGTPLVTSLLATYET